MVAVQAGMRKALAVDELVHVAAPDPLNLVAITSSGPRVSFVLGNAILYRNGLPLASLKAGEVVELQALPAGARVESNLVYHPPPHPAWTIVWRRRWASRCSERDGRFRSAPVR